jgi:hypothetical protein
MDNTARTIALKYLVAQYLQSIKDVRDGERQLNEAKEALSRYRNKQGAYSDTLRAEGIDPDDIPLQLIEKEMDSPSESPENEPWLQDDDSSPEQQPLVMAENNGHSQMLEWPTPLNDTHAVFLVFKNSRNPWLNSDEIYKKNLDYGYGLTKAEVLRIVGRQMGRPKKMFEKDGEKYRLSPLGLAFEGFRKKGAEVPLTIAEKAL